MKTLWLLVILGVVGCGNGGGVNFCQPGETCTLTPAEKHTGVFCGGKECEWNACYKDWFCTGQNKCSAHYSEPNIGHDLCIHYECDLENGWIKTPLTPAEIDDGDPCTLDQCDPDSGPIHTNTCG